MKKLILTSAFIFITGICSAQVSIDSIRPYWNGNFLDSIYFEYTTHIPFLDTVTYSNATNDGVVKMGLSFIGCSSAVAVQKDTMLFFYNDSIPISINGGIRIATVWNVSSICNLPINPIITFSFTIFPILTSIDKIENLSNRVAIFPNPANEYFTLKIEGGGVIIEQIAIIDLQGRLVKSYQNSKTSLDINGVGNGVYFLKITTNKGVALKKLIVN